VAYVSSSHHNPFSQNRLAGLRTVYARAGLSDAVKVFACSIAANELDARRDALRSSLAGRVERAVRRERRSDRQLGHALAGLRQELTAFLGREVVRAEMLPLLRRAAADSEVTAWVAATDTTALQCLHYLRQSGVDVPGRLSVVGFDDTVEASMLRLTSYNFNFEPTVQAMLRHVVAPKGTQRGRGPMPLEIGGFVTARDTSGPAVAASRGRA
jgi:DNA-binding LacI/PurR family transcriptional regulator